jgi:AAA domain
MATAPQRPASLEDHPISRRTYRIPTPSIAAFRALVDECLLLYITGALIHGRPRIGKTYAIEFIRRDLERRHPRLSIYKMRCTRSQTPSENSFFSALLYAANHPAQSGASKAALRGRLLHKLRQVADTKGDERIVLFADEAQNLHELHYEWLRDLHDELESNGLRLFVFLVGQSQLVAQKSAFQAQDKGQIVARFMVEELAFRGITSAAQCRAVLKAYDQGEYPEASGRCYTRFHVPQAYDAGLRMLDSAGALWHAFEDAHIKAQLDGPVEIPMKYFTTAAEASLLISSASDSPTLTFDTPFWTSMVERSRYVLAQKAGSTTLSAISR